MENIVHEFWKILITNFGKYCSQIMENVVHKFWKILSTNFGKYCPRIMENIVHELWKNKSELYFPQLVNQIFLN